MYPNRLGYGYAGGGGPANIGYMLTQFDVLSTLSTQQLRSRNRQVDPAFATAVFIQYISGKLAKGKTKFDTSLKVEELERGLPQFVRSFHEARERTGLPPSRIFPALRRTVTSGPSTGPSARLARTSTSTGHPNIQGANVSAIAARNSNVQTVRPIPAPSAPASGAGAGAGAAGGEGEDLPPPPYSRMDPEPEMTAVLERQLSNAPTSNVARPTSTSGANFIPSGIPENTDSEQRELQQALEASRQAEMEGRGGTHASVSVAGRNDDPVDREERELEQALEESRRQAEEDERRRRESQGYSGNGVAGGEEPMVLGATLPVHGNTSMDGLSGRMQTMDLMDSDTNHLQATQRPLEPIRTGSNNPFASAHDAQGSSFSATPRASNNPFENPSYENSNTNTDGAGSARTSYAPPSQPPPGWQGQYPPAPQNQPPANPFLQPQRASLELPPPVAPKPVRPGSGEMIPARMGSHREV